jgi:hypothetical protein
MYKPLGSSAPLCAGEQGTWNQEIAKCEQKERERETERKAEIEIVCVVHSSHIVICGWAGRPGSRLVANASSNVARKCESSH